MAQGIIINQKKFIYDTWTTMRVCTLKIYDKNKFFINNSFFDFIKIIALKECIMNTMYFKNLYTAKI